MGGYLLSPVPTIPSAGMTLGTPQGGRPLRGLLLVYASPGSSLLPCMSQLHAEPRVSPAGYYTWGLRWLRNALFTSVQPASLLLPAQGKVMEWEKWGSYTGDPQLYPPAS